jgi:anhydro-N-acetylmuramic acid kinase
MSAACRPDQVEAAAFAWLRARSPSGFRATRASVTGAAGARLLGALYPAG